MALVAAEQSMSGCTTAHLRLCQGGTFLPEWRHSFPQNLPSSCLEPWPKLLSLSNLITPLPVRRMKAVLSSEEGPPTAQPKARRKQTQRTRSGKHPEIAPSSETGRPIGHVETRADLQQGTTVWVIQTPKETLANTGFKTCLECGHSKAIDDFGKSRTSLDERSAACRACMATLRARRAGRPLFHLGMSVEEAWENAKVCKKCGYRKELRDFARWREGTHSWCRGCHAKFVKQTQAPVDTPQRCNECEEVKPASEFYRDPRRQNGLSGDCKSCCTNMRRARYKKHYQEAPPVLLPRAEKMCTVCRKELPRKEFYARVESIDGLGSSCKTCILTYLSKKLREKKAPTV